MLKLNLDANASTPKCELDTCTVSEGITKKQSHYAQTLADNIDTIEEVIKEAKDKEEIPTRYDVLKEFYLLTTMIKYNIINIS